MSNHHLSLVRRIETLKGPARAVLFVLADRADENGNCYPGMAKIAKESGFSRSTVKTALRNLKAEGWISWRQQRNEDGELTSNFYTIDLGRAAVDPPRAAADLGVGRELTYPRAGAGHKASIEAPIRSTNEASLFLGDILPTIKPMKTSQQELAALIYQEYPRKAAKENALKAILKAMKGNDPDFLLERTKAYAASIGWKDKQFIPYPASWFNSGSFKDDPEEWKQPAQKLTNRTNPPATVNTGRRAATIEEVA